MVGLARFPSTVKNGRASIHHCETRRREYPSPRATVRHTERTVYIPLAHLPSYIYKNIFAYRVIPSELRLCSRMGLRIEEEDGWAGIIRRSTLYSGFLLHVFVFLFLIVSLVFAYPNLGYIFLPRSIVGVFPHVHDLHFPSCSRCIML